METVIRTKGRHAFTQFMGTQARDRESRYFLSLLRVPLFSLILGYMGELELTEALFCAIDEYSRNPPVSTYGTNSETQKVLRQRNQQFLGNFARLKMLVAFSVLGIFIDLIFSGDIPDFLLILSLGLLSISIGYQIPMSIIRQSEEYQLKEQRTAMKVALGFCSTISLLALVGIFLKFTLLGMNAAATAGVLLVYFSVASQYGIVIPWKQQEEDLTLEQASILGNAILITLTAVGSIVSETEVVERVQLAFVNQILETKYIMHVDALSLLVRNRFEHLHNKIYWEKYQ